MEVGKRYNIKQTKRKKSRVLNGICIGEEDRFYILESKNGYKECFLKADIATGEYKVKEA